MAADEAADAPRDAPREERPGDERDEHRAADQDGEDVELVAVDRRARRLQVVVRGDDVLRRLELVDLRARDGERGDEVRAVGVGRERARDLEAALGPLVDRAPAALRRGDLARRVLDVERGELRVPPEEHAERRVHARGVLPFTASRSASSDAIASVWWRMSSLMGLT